MHLCTTTNSQREVDWLIPNYFSELQEEVLVMRTQFQILLKYDRVTWEGGETMSYTAQLPPINTQLLSQYDHEYKSLVPRIRIALKGSIKNHNRMLVPSCL